MTITSEENVSYYHMMSSYIRGKWGIKEIDLSTIIMARCCHVLDLIAWFMSGVKPVLVSSMGSLMYFRRDKAPVGAGTRCLKDCPIEKDCAFSAGPNYLDWDRFGWSVWNDDPDRGDKFTYEQKEQMLR